MMNRRNCILWIVLILVLLGCGSPGKKAKFSSEVKDSQEIAEQEKVSKITWNLEYEPKSIDPQNVSDVSGMQIINSCFEGLTRIGKNGEVIPGMAEKWEVDGNVWVFHIRKNSKWSNGDTVTANDFYEGIKRGIEPGVSSEYAYLTYYIKGAQAYNEKKITDFNQVGIKIVDDYTLKIELEKPTSYFDAILTFPIYMPINKKFYDLQKEKYGLEADKMVYNGPWKIGEWIHENKFELKKNLDYWNWENIKIDYLTFLVIRDYTTAVNMFKNNEMDITNVSVANLIDFEKKEEIKSFVDGSPFYIELNTKNKVLSNKKIRQAISYAIDRKSFVEKIMQDDSVPALAMIPYGIPGKNSSFREDYGAELFSDGNIEGAKALYMQGLKELKIKGRVSLKLACDNRDTSQKYMLNIQEQLNKNLGIDVVLEPVTFQMRLQKMTSKEFDMLFAGWGPDYNDPMTYMDLWITNGGNNHTSWSNTSYDKFIQTAQITSDKAIRMDAMSQAEKILIDEMPIVPLFYRSRNYIVKEDIKGVVRRMAGADVDFYWASR